MWVAVALSVFAGVVSAFVDNVATVLMIAPVALSIAKKLKTSPVALLICIAVSSNLQGAATLVGDTMNWQNESSKLHGRLRQHGLFGLHRDGRQMLHLLCR